MYKIILNVEGMSCEHCKKRVESALNAIEGVASSSVNLTNKEVTIEYDKSSISDNKLKNTIEEAGYSVL